ncbi:MAG TPA: ferritin-like domain-containing protein [Candidatus Deferrimicrobium sp.]|nr:ferritin-like domain-containing protein [Candidatus Deferrimicrobium sp.]
MSLKVSVEYLDLLNKAIARELAVAVQYMIQHSRLVGVKKRLVPENILLDETTFDVLSKIFEEIAIVEMKHAEGIAERVYLLGGEATTKPEPITVGTDIKEFLELGVKAEKEALELYQKILGETITQGDYTTRLLFLEIFKEEEEHLIKFGEYLP